jgi:hypothetical protein
MRNAPIPNKRCSWVKTDDPLLVNYHDHEWGVPVRVPILARNEICSSESIGVSVACSSGDIEFIDPTDRSLCGRCPKTRYGYSRSAPCAN